MNIGRLVKIGLLLIATAGISRASAGSNPAEIRWSELASLAVGHEVSIPLRGGGAVAGEVLSVREDSLMLDVRRTSDPKRFAKGQQAIPRGEVTEVRLSERRGSGGRILGSVVGALIGIVAGAEIALHGTRTEGPAVATFTGMAVGSTVGGYYAGRSMDLRTKTLHIASQ